MSAQTDSQTQQTGKFIPINRRTRVASSKYNSPLMDDLDGFDEEEGVHKRLSFYF